jgi:hypothetical protein
MIIPGIKIGPQHWQERIAIGPKFVEIWYQVDRAEIYTPMFSDNKGFRLDYISGALLHLVMRQI